MGLSRSRGMRLLRGRGGVLSEFFFFLFCLVCFSFLSFLFACLVALGQGTKLMLSNIGLSLNILRKT